MTFEAFQQVITLLQKDSDRSAKIYKLGIDLYNFQDDLHSAINILFKSHYSAEGEDLIGWWLWEDVEKFLYDKDGEKTNDLTKLEDLWKYIEEIRKSPDFKEYNPEKVKKKTKKQLEKIFGQFFSPKN
jgi:hypothetical protein